MHGALPSNTISVRKPNRNTSDTAQFSAKLIDDLANRMSACLEEFMGWAKKTKDEDEGHAFHGNQWTGGIGGGPKPTTVKAKSAKGGIHELLSSGHPFTKKELMDATGITSDKTLQGYLSDLKNPKYAGPKGALTIMKMADGQFQIVKKEEAVSPEILASMGIPSEGLGEPIGPAALLNKGKTVAQEFGPADIDLLPKSNLPPHLEKLAEKMTAAGHMATITEVHVPGYTDPEPAAKAAPTTEKKSKAEADKDYNASINNVEQGAGAGSSIPDQHSHCWNGCGRTVFCSWSRW